MSVVPLRSRPAVAEEEFLAWYDDPVTQWVLAACRKAADECREAWIAETWKKGGVPDPMIRLELFTMADAYRALADTQYAGWLATQGEDE